MKLPSHQEILAAMVKKLGGSYELPEKEAIAAADYVLVTEIRKKQIVLTVEQK